MRWFALLLALHCFHAAFAANNTVMDDVGHRVVLSNPAQRIISLAPDVTETLFAIGAGSQIVGVIKGSDYPVQVLQRPIVGSYSGLDVERILLLHPDLVIVWGSTFARQIAILHTWHIPVYVTQPTQLQDIPKTMRQLGVLTGHDAEADQQARLFEQRVAALRKQYQQQPPVTVFYQLGATGLMTINRDSWINQVITLCGGRNVFADAITTAPEVSLESVVAANPDVILNDSDYVKNWQAQWRRWQSLSAVRQRRLYAVHADWIDRAGPRLPLGVAEVCGFLHQNQ